MPAAVCFPGGCLLPRSLRNELEEVEKRVCPNLSSSRNAFQARCAVA